MIDFEELEDITREARKKENVIPLENFKDPEKRQTCYEEKLMSIFKDGKRSDGRTNPTHRKMFVQLGAMSDAAGSCYIELGDTKLIVSVRGPKEIPNIQEYTELCALECSTEYAPFLRDPTIDEKFLSEAMRTALEPHEFPNLQITLSTFVIEDGGSVLSAAITGASLALIHARIPTFGIVTSATMGLHNSNFMVDPSKEEEDFCLNPIDDSVVDKCGLVTIAYMPLLDQITLYNHNGCMDFDDCKKTRDELLEQCKQLEVLCEQHLMRELKIAVKHIAASKLAQESLSDLSLN